MTDNHVITFYSIEQIEDHKKLGRVVERFCVKNKISLYCDVHPKSVISLRDFESVYDIPIHLEEQGLGNIIIDKLGYKNKTPDLKKWKLF